MRRALPSLVLALAAGCVWPAAEPSARWPRPADFGVLAWEGAILRTPEYASVVSDGLVYVSTLEGPGRDARLQPAPEPTLGLVAVDPRSGVVRTLPAPPLSVQSPRLWPAAGGVIATVPQRAARFDGSGWTELPPLPVVVPDFLRGLPGGFALLRQGRQAWVLGSGSWRPVNEARDPSVTGAVFGPAGNGEVRLIYGHGANGLCTLALALDDLRVTRPAVCLAGQPEPPSDEVMNGTLDDFQAWAAGLVDVQLWHFSASQWTRGAAVRGSRLRWTPNAAFAIGSIDVPGSIALQNLTRLEAGRATQTLFVQSWELFGCDGELRTCARSPGFVRELVEEDGAAALFLIENLVDARRALYVKRLPLPHRDGGSCSPDCTSGQLCVRGSGIANLCVADPALAP